MNKRTLQMIIFFIALTAFLMFVYDVPLTRTADKLVFLDDGWTITENGSVYEEMPAQRFVSETGIAVQTGQEISLTCMLPERKPVEQPALLIKTRACNVSVLLDGEAVFSHNHTSEGYHSRYILETHYIDLPPSYEGKELTLLLTPTADHAFGGLTPPVFGSHLDLLSYTTYRGLLPILSSVSLCMYGILFIMLSIVLSSQMPALLSQIYAAMLCMMIGIWMLGYHEVFSLLLDAVHSRFLETVMQFASVPVFFLYMRSLQLSYFRKQERGFAYLLSAFALIIIVLEWTVALPTNFLMGIYIPLSIVALWTVLRYFIYSVHIRQLEPSLVLQMFGLAVMLLCCLSHIIFYFAYDFYGIPRGLFGRNVMMIGVTIFQETQLVNFFFFITRLVAEQMNHPDLEDLAYRDFLTRLPNRTDAEQVFARMAKTQDDFCIMMLDLNGLKDVNDRYGHSEGDRFLSESAQAMRIAFGEGAYLSRVGGDEFVVVLEGENEGQVERRLESLEAILSHLGDATPDIERSIAYGYAFRHECAEVSPVQMEAEKDDSSYTFFSSGAPGSGERRKTTYEKRQVVKKENEASSASKFVSDSEIVRSVIALADKRMYEKKRIMKGRAAL